MDLRIQCRALAAMVNGRCRMANELQLMAIFPGGRHTTSPCDVPMRRPHSTSPFDVPIRRPHAASHAAPHATVTWWTFCRRCRYIRASKAHGPNCPGEEHMRKTLMVAGAALVLAAGPATAQNKTIKIGFISTFSGPVAAIGNDMRNSFELALDHMGRKMGGLPVEVIYEDDGFKPEVGKQKTDKLIESDKVDFIVGYIW